MNDTSLLSSAKKTCVFEKKYFFPIALATLAFLFLLICNRSSSFLNLADGYDNANFKLFGLSIVRGKVPLRDYADRKGPYLFFINAIPALTHTWRAGLFLIQFAFLFCVTSLIKNQLLRVTSAKNTFWALCLMYYFYAIFYGEGGQVEDYILLFCVIPLYLCASFLFSKVPASTHPKHYTFVYGLCFGCIAFLRLNDTATICAILLAFAFLLLKEKKPLTLLLHALIFLLGLCISSLPAVLYYAKNHALSDMIYWTFIEGFSYNTKSRSQLAVSYICRIVQFIPVFFSVFFARIYDKREGTNFFPVFLTAAILLFFTVGNNNYEHYFITLLPFYAVAFAGLLTQKNMLSLCALVLFFIPPSYTGDSVRPGFSNVARNYALSIKNCGGFFAYQKESKRLFSLIPPSEQDQLFSYNLFYGIDFYSINRALPPNKWYVMWYGRRTEWKNEFYATKPHWVLYEVSDRSGKRADIPQGYNVVSEVSSARGAATDFTLLLLERL